MHASTMFQLSISHAVSPVAFMLLFQPFNQAYNHVRSLLDVFCCSPSLSAFALECKF